MDLQQLVSSILETNPRQAAMLARAQETLREDERSEVEAYLSLEADFGFTPKDLSSAYNLVVLDTLREQMFFRRHGRYRHQRFSDVASSVYFSPDYMRQYMQGLALTGFLWPNHVSIRRFFTDYLERVPAGQGDYLEVGPGHGIYMASAVRSAKYARYLGVDISPTSLELTRRMLTHATGEQPARFQLQLGNFLETSFDRSFDMIVMGEVLEHVEDPCRFLRHARDAISPNGAVFISTCINSPATDHIYLFKHDSEVGALASAAGLTIQSQLIVPYHGTDLSQSYAEMLPVNIAMVLSR
jgi:2-polyprenyl-3-methyl-5-hydroxy-6-metoxy-1,4-benzoquinol methylase